MSRRLAIATGAAVAATILAIAAPLLLRQMPFFALRRVELVGVRYLAAERVVESLGLAPDQNLFDPLDEAAGRVRGLAGVVSAELQRRLPGTLRVTLVERMPVALVSGPERLVALDCDGRPLPYDPTRSALDLPLVERADRTLVRTLCIVRTSDSTMYGDVDWARLAGDGAVALQLERLRVVLRTLPTTQEIRAVGAVRRHLVAADRPVAELDARFAGWVVARRSRT